MIKRLEDKRKNNRGEMMLETHRVPTDWLRSKQVQGSRVCQCPYLAQMIFYLFKDRVSFESLQIVA